MKPRLSNQQNAALTLVEVTIVIAVLVIVVALILPALAMAKRKTSKISCANDLKEVGIAFRLWEGDNNDKYPMAVSLTNGGAMELIATGNVTACFQVMSNEVNIPKILLCPEDTRRVLATNWSTLNNSNISYFVGLDADTNRSKVFFSGDDNFAVGGIPVKSGLLKLPTNAPVTWTAARHKFTGFIVLADGSARHTDDKLLVQELIETGVATNRLAIP